MCGIQHGPVGGVFAPDAPVPGHAAGLNSGPRMVGMGRILSGRLRSAYVADPGSAGANGRFQRGRIMRDVELAVDDIETILRMSPDDKLREHVRRQVARLVGGAGGTGDDDGGGGGGAWAGSDGDEGNEHAGAEDMGAEGTAPEGGVMEGGEGAGGDVLEDELWN